MSFHFIHSDQGYHRFEILLVYEKLDLQVQSCFILTLLHRSSENYKSIQSTFLVSDTLFLSDKLDLLLFQQNFSIDWCNLQVDSVRFGIYWFPLISFELLSQPPSTSHLHTLKFQIQRSFLLNLIEAVSTLLFLRFHKTSFSLPITFLLLKVSEVSFLLFLWFSPWFLTLINWLIQVLFTWLVFKVLLLFLHFFTQEKVLTFYSQYSLWYHHLLLICFQKNCLKLM